MNLALIYSQIQALSLIILPITSLLVIITFILQIYTLLTNRSLKQQNPVKFSRQNSDQVELDFDIQPLLNKNNDDVKQQEIQQNPKNDIDNVLKNIGRLLMIEQICDIKISVQKYDDQYQEDFKKFEQNFKDFFRNDQEKQQKVREILQQLYENTNQKRQVQEEYKSYVRPIQDEKSLKKNYSLQLQESKTLSQYCNAFREVRGDGNCFYTAFGYQFLQILLFHYSFQQFFEFIKKIKNIELSMKIFVQDINFKIDDKEIQKILLQEFVNRLIQLKSIKDINLRQESFFKQFAAYQYESDDVDGCFYGLSTIFFRNYSDYIINQSEMKETIYDREKLLQWEQECDNNETVISELAKSLNVQIIYFNLFSDLWNQYFLVKIHYRFVNKENQKIILLIKPGHYNIGILRQKTQSEILIQKNEILYQELINQNLDNQKIQQFIQEQANLKLIIRNLQDQFQKGQLPEEDVWNLKEGLQYQHQEQQLLQLL